MPFQQFLPKFDFKGDKILLSSVFVLSGISLILILSAGSLTIKDTLFFLLSYGLMYIFYKIDYKFFSIKGLIYTLFAAALGMLLWTVFVVQGRSINIGGFHVQTFFPIGVILIFFFSHYLASHINKKENTLTSLNTWFLVGVTLFFCTLMFLRNQSSAIILAIILFLMMWVVRAPKIKKIILGIVVLATIAGSVIFIASVRGSDVKEIGRLGTLTSRVYTFINNEYTEQGMRAEAAISLAPVFPSMLGKGVVKNKLQEGDNDYIFSILCEEMGLIVAFAVILAYVIILYRAIRISTYSEGAFAMLLSCGIGFWFCAMAFVHIAVNINIIPATGQTLPFISRGGTSLMLSGSVIGILLNISKTSTK